MLRWVRQKPHKPTNQDLDDALAVAASFQGCIQHADAKAGVLVVLHAGAAAIVATQASAGARLGQIGAVAGLALLSLFLLGFAVSGYHMLQAVRPILRSPAVQSRYSITGIGCHVPSPATEDLPVRITEAWAMARLLAQIAERKYRHVSRSVPWTGLMLGAAVCWTTLVAVWR